MEGFVMWKKMIAFGATASILALGAGISVAEANSSECRRNDPTRTYVSRNPDQCAAIRFFCEEGKQPFFNECGCGCETVVTCGSNVCGAGEYCCNASCGICAPEGGGCIQMVCEEPLL
jgi:hypothetical protein